MLHTYLPLMPALTKVSHLDNPALSIFSLMVMPFMAAAVEEATLIECIQNCGLSTSLATIGCFIHLAIVEVVAGPWGY